MSYTIHRSEDSRVARPEAVGLARANEVANASVGEAPQAHHLLDRLKERHPTLLGACEADRLAQKFRCPAVHYGVEYQGQAECEVKESPRVQLKADRRIFTPLARASYA